MTVSSILFKQTLERFKKDVLQVNEIIHLRNSGIFLIPVLDRQGKVINIINLHKQRSFLPVDALIMVADMVVV